SFMMLARPLTGIYSAVPDFVAFSFFYFEGYGDHRDLHNKAHSFPTRRSSDLMRVAAGAGFTWVAAQRVIGDPGERSEEHTSELQSRLVISYAVFFLNKKKY